MGAGVWGMNLEARGVEEVFELEGAVLELLQHVLLLRLPPTGQCPPPPSDTPAC